MEGHIVAMHALGFMIKPDDGSPDIYFGCPEPHEAGWHKRQRVTFTLAPALAGAVVRTAIMVQTLPDLAREEQCPG